jgi:hypothetical protein
VLSPYNANLLTPAFIERKQVPLDTRREVTQDGFGSRVDVKRRSNEIETRVERRKLNVAKVAVTLEVALPCGISGLDVVMTDANPVIEPLEGEMKVVIRFELDDGKAAIAGNAQ